MCVCVCMYIYIYIYIYYINIEASLHYKKNRTAAYGRAARGRRGSCSSMDTMLLSSRRSSSRRSSRNDIARRKHTYIVKFANTGG